METIKIEKKLCMCCMREHEVKTVRFFENNIFKGERIEYPATYEYCDDTDEYIATEEMTAQNDIAMKDAYRKKLGLLTSDQIIAIRAKYGISQSDLSILLGWGQKTITRYESHQVQDVAHNTILVKLDSDPQWFIELLKKAREDISSESYARYMTTATALYKEASDSYLRKAIFARYECYANDCQSTGGTLLNLDKVVDIINYIANSEKVTGLFLVKLMKLIWYSDALSYKRYGKSMTGLVYQSRPMGAVPLEHKSLIDLTGVEYEEIVFGDGVGYRFGKTKRTEYASLSRVELDILNTVIEQLGDEATDIIVERMHKEVAYKETARGDIIQFKYARDLTLS